MNMGDCPPDERFRGKFHDGDADGHDRGGLPADGTADI